MKKNYTRGFLLLKKAAAMVRVQESIPSCLHRAPSLPTPVSASSLQGSIDALNALGWYHGIILGDHSHAVEYFEQAARNGSADGMFNLGIYHLRGKTPRSPRGNEVGVGHRVIALCRGRLQCD